MAKEYYLIKTWTPHRGQTSEKPSCLFYGSKIYSYPLTEKVKSYLCYTSRGKAERVIMKNEEGNLWCKYELFRVPGNMVEVYIQDKVTHELILKTEA